MKTGFVIVNYNDYKTTIDLINNIKQYNIIDKIVVVDNYSSDNSYEELVKYINDIKNKKEEIVNDKIKIIKESKNNGYSAGLNIGCKYLIDTYKECNIFISNADIIINKEADLEELLKIIDDKNVIVAPNILEKENISRGWKIPTPMQEVLVNLPLIEKSILKKLKYNNTLYNKEILKVDTVSGCFFLINSKHLENIKYFDENVFLYYEENIFGVKTKKLNKNIVIVNNVNVIHNHSVSIDKSIKRINKVKIQKKSQYYFEKEYNNANLFELLLLKITVIIGRLLLRIKYILD